MTTKILVAYYSKTGNTGRMAKEIAARLGADIETIIDKKSRKGLFGFIFGGRDAMKKMLTAIETPKFDAANYDLVIVGTPVWASDMTPAVRTYLAQNKNKIKNLACFDASGNIDPAKIAASVGQVAGKKPIAFTGVNDEERKNSETVEKKIAAFVGAIKKA